MSNLSKRGFSEIPTESDTTANFKLNSVLKEEFEKLCKANHSNLSRELKQYMTYAVKTKDLHPKSWFFF